MAELPSFSNFRQRLEQEHGCRFCEAGNLQCTDGQVHSIAYIERIVDGESLTYVFVIDREGMNITWHLVRSVCARLRIDPASFGLDLDKLKKPEDLFSPQE